MNSKNSEKRSPRAIEKGTLLVVDAEDSSSSLLLFRHLYREKKRHLDMRIQQLEEEVEEAQMNLAANNEKLIKASNDVRKAVDDLNAEKGKIQRLTVGESRSAVPRAFAVFNRRSIVIWKSKSEN